MQTKPASSSVRYNKRVMRGFYAVIALTAAVLLGMRAIDTGSLQQYTLMAVSFVAAIYQARRALQKI
jgi:hypothetical protein